MAQESTLATWSAALNQHHSEMTGERPYFLAGDPGIDLVPQTKPVPEVRLSSVRQEMPPTRVGKAWIAEEFERANRMGALAQAIFDHDDQSHGNVAGSSGTLQQLASRYPSFLRRACRAMQTGTFNGNPDAVYHRLKAVSDRYEDAWQQSLAECLNDGLIQRYLETYFTDGHFLENYSALGTCSSCRGTIRSERWRSADSTTIFVTRCAVCGLRTLRSTASPLGSPTITGRLARGDSLRLKVADVQPGTSFIVHFRDNGDGRFYRIGAGTASSGQLDFCIPIPQDATPEVHTVRLGLVHRTKISIFRWRFPPDLDHSAWFREEVET